MPQLPNDPVCIVGTGAFTVLGHSAPSAAAAVRAGIVRQHEDAVLCDQRGEPLRTAGIKQLAAVHAGANRLLALAAPAGTEALASLARQGVRIPSANVQLVIGLPEGTKETEKMGRKLCSALGLDMSALPAISFLSGHTAGIESLGHASAHLMRQDVALCLVVSADSYLEPERAAELIASRRLQTSDHPFGFVPGEAGAGLALMRRSMAQRLRLSSLVEVLGVAVAAEPAPVGSKETCTGEGLTVAVRAATDALGWGEQCQQVYCDLNGEPYRVDELGFALTRLGSRIRAPWRLIAPAECWGDIGAASGAAFVALAVEAGMRRYAAGPHALICTSSDRGVRAAALLRIHESAASKHEEKR